MCRLNLPHKPFYNKCSETYRYELDPNSPSTWSEAGGKQWQHNIRVWGYWYKTSWPGQDDVMAWKLFMCYWPFVSGIHRSPSSRKTIHSLLRKYAHVLATSLKTFLCRRKVTQALSNFPSTQKQVYAIDKQVPFSICYHARHETKLTGASLLTQVNLKPRPENMSRAH